MASEARDAEESPALTMQRLLPHGTPTTVERFIDDLDLADRVADGHLSRPHVLLNMVSTADGRATLGGRSGAIGGGAHPELFHGLRPARDAVMVGARTGPAPRHR